MKTKDINFNLTDDSTAKERTLPFRISFNKHSITITPKGYGDYESEDGEGTPILIEFWEGKPRVIVWDDINKEDYHVISLKNAAETNRIKTKNS